MACRQQNSGVGMLKKKRKGRMFELQFLISIAFTIVAITGIVFVGGALYIPFYNSTLEMVKHDNSQVVDQVNLNLDGYLRSMMKISDSVYYKILKNSDVGEDNINEELSLLYDVNMDRLISIGIFYDSGKVLNAVPLSNIKPTVDVKSQEWFTKAKRRIENLHFSTPHVQNIFQDSDLKYRWVVSLSRSIDLTYRGQIRYGVLLVDMNFSAIEQICKKVVLGDTGYVYIMDSDGEIIYHPDQQLIYSNLNSENVEKAVTYEDGSYIEDYKNRERVITVKTVGYTGWKIVGVAYVDELTQYKDIVILIILIILIAISLMILLNQYISSRIANPIKVLERSVQKITLDDNDEHVVVSGSLEVQHLATAINSMLDRIKSLMQEVLNEQEQKLKSELDALQSQINPHFLYNALDSIVWMIEKGNHKQAVIMVTSISKLFRISISRGNNIIPVADELEHARNYLMIQILRFKNKFEYEFNVSEDVKEMKTIKLIVQPIIENAIYHGMEFMDGDGLISINAFIKDGILTIEVADNGLGISPEVAKQLLSKPSKKSKGSGIGLYNVQKRIQLYFGLEYGLTIESEPDEGTKVSIKLPAQKFDDGLEDA